MKELRVALIVKNLGEFDEAKHMLIPRQYVTEGRRHSYLLNGFTRVDVLSCNSRDFIIDDESFITERLRARKINVAILYHVYLPESAMRVLWSRFLENQAIVFSFGDPEEVCKELTIMIGRGGAGNPRTLMEYLESRIALYSKEKTK